jgi:hypothetical protein
MVLNGALFVALPSAKNLAYDEYRVFFLSFIGLALLTFPICVLIYRRYLSHKNLEVAFRAMGLNGASTTFKTGCILAAVIGDMTGLSGAALFAYSRDAYALSFFLVGWTVQYAASIYWLRRGKAILQRFANSPNAASAAA